MSFSRNISLLSGSLIVILVLAMGGCANLDLRGDGLIRDETFDSAGQCRSQADHVDLFGFSNKARQIERNCGAR